MWPLAVALAWKGSEVEAREAVVEGLALASGSGHALYEVGCLSALGLLELSLERGGEAAGAWITRAREGAAARGVRALGRLPLLPESVEALAMSAELERAAALATEVQRRATVLGRPWAVALAHRCRGLVAESAGENERAVARTDSRLCPRTPVSPGGASGRGPSCCSAGRCVAGTGSETRGKRSSARRGSSS